MSILVNDSVARASAAATAVTSASFTPATGATIFVCTVGGGSAGTPTVNITNTGGGLSAWTLVAQANNTTVGGTENGVAAIHRATVNTSVATTITATQTSGSSNTIIKIYIVTGHESVSANVVSFHGTGDHLTNPITTQRANSLIILCASEWDNSGAPVGPSTLITDAFAASNIASVFGYNIVTGNDAELRFLLDASATGAWKYVILEILDQVPTPAAGSQNGSALSLMF